VTTTNDMGLLLFYTAQATATTTRATSTLIFETHLAC